MKRLTKEQLQFIYDNADKSILWISREMKIGKSTISFHLKPYREKNNIPKVTCRTSAVYIEHVEKTRKNLDFVAKSFADSIWEKNKTDQKFIYGCLLYWCEGNRSHSFTFSNTNINILSFVVKWIEDYFPMLVWKYRIKYPPGANTEEIETYWKQVFKKPAIGVSLAKNTRSEYGVIQIETSGFAHGQRAFVPILESYLADYVNQLR